MICPGCPGEIEPGYAELRGTFSDAMTHGWSHLILTFSGPEITELNILKPSERGRAGFCPSCGLVVITHEPWIP
jgi:hypothetical protein